MKFKFPKEKQSRNNKAVSTVISTVILTATIVSLLVITLVFANNFLWTKMAESDFSAAKQFMQNIGLQIDDVAWIAGRTQTLRYSSKYGDVNLLPAALNYSIYIQTEKDGDYELFASYEVGVLLFNLPVSRYSIADDYYELLFPESADTLMLKGTSAPVVRVFAVEKILMGDGSYTRVVIAPSVRLLNSTVTREGGAKTLYLKLYIPVLTLGDSPRISQSVTITGKSVSAVTRQITGVNITVTFPKSSWGFDNSFFHFPSLYELIVPDEYDTLILEVFSSEVEVSLGAHA